jgi:uncharacterized cupredoxin-like copper-binding protein
MKKSILVLVFLLSIFSLSVLLGTIQAQTPTVQVTLYAGQISTSQYGFGNSSSSLTSPGPTLTFHVGDVVKVTVNNVGTMLHSWEINTQNSTRGQVLFNSDINPNTYIALGQSGSVTFTVSGNAGNYYYICPVPGHAQLGMWGNCIIESAIPEFPAPLLLVFVAVAVTALAAYVGRINIKRKITI